MSIRKERKIQEEIKEGAGKIRRILEEIEGRGGKGIEEDGERLRKWRKEGGNGKEYRERKRKYKGICERKKEEERERMMREAGETKSERKVWELVNRERKKKRRVKEEIKMEE